MNICFVLTGFAIHPSGGYKMVYEYANRFVDDGYNVKILYLNEFSFKRYPMPDLVRRSIANSLTHRGPQWFSLNPKIQTISSYDKNLKAEVSSIDVVIYTAVETVRKGNLIFKINCCKKLYYIQGYENWNVSDEYVKNTYSFGYTNIVISDWLKKIVDKYGKKPAILIKDPIDLDVYKEIISPKKRREHTISVLYHTGEYKGFRYAYEAIRRLKKIYTDLEVYAFGTFPKPKNFPEYVHYTRSASQKQTVEIYNKTQVFLCATVEEGYGLTGLEAMACGCALVSTEYRGVLEYARNHENALLSPVKDIGALVKNVQQVFEDDELRDKLVQNAKESVRAFSWNRAVKEFEKAIRE